MLGFDSTGASEQKVIEATAGAILLSEAIRDLRVIRKALTSPEQ